MQTFTRVVSPDIVDVLRQEHEQIRQLCTAVRRADPGRRKAALAALQQAVHLHQAGEHAVAHPAVRNLGPAADAIALNCQVRGEQLDRSLTELDRRGTGHPGFDDDFATLSTALAGHAADQERDELPLLRLYVPAQRLHMMASAMQDVRIMTLA